MGDQCVDRQIRQWTPSPARLTLKGFLCKAVAGVMLSLLLTAFLFPQVASAQNAPIASVSFDCTDRLGGEFALAITISGDPDRTLYDVYVDGVFVAGNVSGGGEGDEGTLDIGGYVGTPFSLSPFTLPAGPHVVTITQPLSQGGEIVQELPFNAFPCKPIEPQTKEDCKNGEFAKYKTTGRPDAPQRFANQGQCIKFVNTGK